MQLVRSRTATLALTAITLTAVVLLARGARSQSQPPPATPLRPAGDDPLAGMPRGWSWWSANQPGGSPRPYCDAAPAMSREPDPDPRSRTARYTLDSGCHNVSPRLQCAVIQSGATVGGDATDCVEVEYFHGNQRQNDAAHLAVECAACPTIANAGALTPNGGIPLCTPDLLTAARAHQPVFNLTGTQLDEINLLYGQALVREQREQAARRAPRAPNQPAPQNDPIWRDYLKDIIRILAPQLGYCQNAPYGLGQLSDGPNYPHNRIDLNTGLIFVDSAADDPGSPMDVGEGVEEFHLARRAFGSDASGPPVDELALELLHEMRHMATLNHGGGDPGARTEVRIAEQMLNEVEDYTRMYEHPYVRDLAPAAAAQLRREHNAGLADVTQCFARVWNVADATHGYPPDTRGIGQMRSNAMLGVSPFGVGMGGMGGMMMPMAMLPMGALRPPMDPPTTAQIGTCTDVALNSRSTDWHAAGDTPRAAPPLGTSVSNNQRCAVAAWARLNPWMAHQMIATMQPRVEQPQPWNTLAHWSWGMPFRPAVYCADAH